MNTDTHQYSNIFLLLLQAYIGDVENPMNNPKNPYSVCCVLYKSNASNAKLGLIALVSLLVIVIVVVVIVIVVIKKKQQNEKSGAGGRSRSDNRLNSMVSNNDSIIDSPFANKKSIAVMRMPSSPNYDRNVNAMTFHSVNSFLRGSSSNVDGQDRLQNVARRVDDFDYEVPVTFTDDDNSNDGEVALPNRQISNNGRPVSMFPESFTLSAEAAVDIPSRDYDDDSVGEELDGVGAAEFVTLPATTLMRNRQIATVTNRVKSMFPPESSA